MLGNELSIEENRASAIRATTVGAMHVVYALLATGMKLRFLALVDKFPWLLPVVETPFSYSSEDVVAMKGMV